MTRHEDNLVIPFDATKGELLAQIAMLRSVETTMKPSHQDRVAELLERLIIFANDYALAAINEVGGIVRVRAPVISIAARIERRTSVADRTIRNWTNWAESLGVLHRDVTSWRYGRREWNTYDINIAKVRELCSRQNRQSDAGSGRRENRKAEAGSGRKWPESVAAPRPESVAAPRPESVAAPSNSRFKEHTHTATNATDTRSHRDTHGKPELKPGEVVRVFFDLGVHQAPKFVADALDRGLSPREVLAIARWFQRSQRRNQHRWNTPSSVLAMRLRAAMPGLPAHCGWIPGNQRQPPTKQVAVDHASRRREREANQRAWQAQPSPLEELKALQLAKESQ